MWIFPPSTIIEFKYFWLLDWYQTDIKNAAIFSFPHGISNNHSKQYTFSLRATSIQKAGDARITKLLGVGGTLVLHNTICSKMST